MQRDLYTVSTDGRDSDEIERWFAYEIEAPGLEATKRLIDDQRLSRDEWHAVVRLYALQEMRTPQSFIEQMRRWDTSLPEILQSTLRESIIELERRRAEGRPLAVEEVQPNQFSQMVKVEIRRAPDPEQDGLVSARILAGRELWLAGIRELLQGRAFERLRKNHWAILIPAPGYEWPLTDHPALRVGFSSLEDYTFEGGWGRRNSDLMMPLSPHHLLHSQVGRTKRGFHQLSEHHTKVVRKLLLQRAHRLAFSSRPVEWIPRERPRVVDREQFDAERGAWGRWHEDQSRAESE